ncbi:Uncharacterized protein FWK35_00036869 [Aphis craccivora]|uniref:Uncharacterized protein n=1 Tax=Aphis craccivora TaxID=307492 RepID=A0A6G0VR03_APHCR|nr:Uncharacterized protein FWK35_00036869 [Aphis craccivora]
MWSVFGLLLATIKYFVFSSFTRSPMVLLAFKSLDAVFMTSSLVSPITTMSSAYANITRSPHISIFRPSHTSLIAFSNARLNKVGDRASPCLRPDFTSKVSDIS